MKKVFQIVYPTAEIDENEIHPLFFEEAKAAEEAGLMVGTKPSNIAEKIMRRGFIVYDQKKYPNDERYINNYEEYANCLYLSRYYQHIEDISIETFFVDELDEKLLDLIREKGWSKVFIKKDTKSLEHIEEGKSVWPYTSLDEIKSLYTEFTVDGKYAIRKFIEPEIMKNELRYWVFNGCIYRRDNIIPDIVKEATSRLNILGSKYYTIDATPEMIIEVNPGETSDRHAENSAGLFVSWIKKEFYYE
jgi:hypothetical protein